MKIEKLKAAEVGFFERYPGGFSNPEMIALRRHHQLDRMVELAQESFAKRNFRHPDLIVDHLVRIITRSSLISRFEKPKFREFASMLPPMERQDLARGLGELLHGDEQTGFEIMLAILRTWKLAKWSLMMICQAYCRPQVEVFVKPTTTKGVIATFELDHLHYEPVPTWGFYEQYRAAINEMKTRVDPSLSPYNIAFTGFLMRSIRGLYKQGYTSLLILSVLAEEPMYGYQIMRELERRSGGYFTMTAALLYPALHQLELDGLLKSDWQAGQGKRKRKYYSITPKGKKALAANQAEWKTFIANLQKTLEVSAGS